MGFKIWPDRKSHNDTLVLHGDTPYDFGVYRGRKRTANLVARLRARGPKFIHDEDTGRGFVTTAGWPWAATLTSGEAALAHDLDAGPGKGRKALTGRWNWRDSSARLQFTGGQSPTRGMASSNRILDR